MRETYQILLTSNCDASLLFFCDRAYSLTIAAIEVVHVLVTIVEAEVVRVVVAVAVVRRRTPTVAVVAVVEER